MLVFPAAVLHPCACSRRTDAIFNAFMRMYISVLQRCSAHGEGIATDFAVHSVLVGPGTCSFERPRSVLLLAADRQHDAISSRFTRKSRPEAEMRAPGSSPGMTKSRQMIHDWGG